MSANNMSSRNVSSRNMSAGITGAHIVALLASPVARATCMRLCRRVAHHGLAAIG
jgi:hypothetical protein